jgi:mRNA interferase YafQ
MLELKPTNQFKRDLKRAKAQNRDIEGLGTVITTLQSCESLAERYKDHKLSGNYKNKRECHIEPDFLLIYSVLDDEYLILERLGSHSELFR